MPAASLLLLADRASTGSHLLQQQLIAVGYRLNCTEAGFEPAVWSAVDPPALVLLLEGAAAQPLSQTIGQLRALQPLLPVFVVLLRDSYSERVQVLRAGADDVISEPYAIEELLARLDALLRRAHLSQNPSELYPAVVLRHRDLSIDTDQRRVVRAGQSIHLTVKEYDLLLHLLRHQGVVQPRLEILKAVWGPTWVGDDNLLDVYIRYLRKKIERPELEPLIHTVRGVGFMLD